MADWKDLLSSFDTVLPPNKRESSDLYSTFNTGLNPHGNKNKSESIEDSVIFGSDTGIVYSDSFALSQKFQIPQEDVLAVFHKFIEDSRRLGYEWVFVDFCRHPHYFNSGFDKSWYTYLRYLHDLCKNNGWNTDISTTLMIVGGNDVIAAPQRVFEVDLLDLHAEIDLLYCFPYGFDLAEEFSHWVKHAKNNAEVYERLVSSALFNVSRIPLPDGQLKGQLTIEDTLQFYFDKVINRFPDMRIANVCMSTANEFQTASVVMSSGLPLVSENRDEIPLAPYGIYQSPYVDVTKGRPIDHPLDIYVADLHSADVLLFNCHGSDIPSASCYGGVEKESQKWYSAFDTHIPDMTSVNKLTLSCACWGARYMHYSQETSILLTSLYKSSVLTFAGSSTIAWGSTSGGYSEVFVRMYIDFLNGGLNAGEAFLRAKLAYMASTRDGDRDTIYLTICEFNLFGDPKLSYKPCGEWRNTDMVPINLVSQKGLSAKSISTVTSLPALDEVYESVQFAVNSSMATIDKMLRDYLGDKYSIRGLKLKGVKKKLKNGIFAGYKFYYSYFCGNEGLVMGITDNEGKSKDIIISK